MKFRNVKTIAFKELKAQFDGVTGYLLIGLFLGLLYYFFLKTFFINGQISLRSMFSLIPWLLIVFVPAITMGSIAGERDKQTIEYLITKPITAGELLWGKLLGTTKFVAVAVLLTLPLAYFINQIGPLDWGEVAAQYFGAILLGFCLCLIGIAVSSFFKSQIAAFLTTAALIFFISFLNSDVTATNLSPELASLLGRLSLIDRYSSIIRGVIQLNDAIYFVVFILLGWAIAYSNLVRIRFASVSESFSRSTIIIFSTGILILGIIYGAHFINGRLDLTQSRKYTLSNTTREVLNEEGNVTINVYSSANLPSQFKQSESELRNILSDYKNYSRGKLTLIYNDAKAKESDLIQKGIAPIQFNVVGQDQYEVKTGYLAVVISDEAGKNEEIINFVSNINNIEYELTTRIHKVKTNERPLIGVATGNGEKSFFEDYSLLRQYLENQYEFKSVYFNGIGVTDKKDENLSQYKLLVIPAPVTDYNQNAKDQIKAYVEAGGKLIYLVDGTIVNQQGLTATKSDPVATEFIRNMFGVTVNNDIVYDYERHLTTVVPTGSGGYVNAPYYFFTVLGLKNQSLPNMPENIITAWPSSLTSPDDSWKTLYTTSGKGGSMTEPFDITPQKELSRDNLSEKKIALVKQLDNGGTVVVIGSTFIFNNEVIQSTQENLILALSMFEDLAQTLKFSEIQSKNLTGYQFGDVTQKQKDLVDYSSPSVSVIILGVIGLQRIYRKRRLAKIYA